MQCPKCDSKPLKPCQLTYGLPSLTCIYCNGHSINLLSYRNWAEQIPDKPTKTSQVTITTDNTSKAMLCSKCSKVMLKYQFSNHHDNRVDICTTCDDAWLDSGEWKLLVELELHNQLTDIITSPWQSKLRDEKSQQRELDDCINRLGEPGFKRASEFKAWLKNHPEKFFILNFLRN
ncbi:MAG: zf-TFIIB domain-containing protein [Arenicella sp.]